jgi:hypothetical protein
VAHNDCGGDTIESDLDIFGTIYHYDATEQLVGANGWGDIVAEPGACPVGPYGEHCQTTSELVTHACSQDGWP